MKDELITFETAKLAKEKGFNELCSAGYSQTEWVKPRISGLQRNSELITGYTAPTQSLLQKWLREKHNVHIELIIDGWGDNQCTEEPCYRAFIWQVGKPKPHHNDDLGCSKYETILEIGLQEGLKLIK